MSRKAIIRKRINCNTMWLTCKFPTGENFKYEITRYGSTLEINNFNDFPKEYVNKVLGSWIAENMSSYGTLFNRLEQLCNTCTSGKELIIKASFIKIF